jgi:hypothetical protein
MSTILDALRKVERERDASTDHPLDPQPLAPVRRRRDVPVIAIALCAILGFAGGALLSWWTPSEEAVEVASLPVPPPPPAIAVPRAPMPEPPVPAAPAPPAEAPVAAPADAPPAPPPSEPAAVAAPQAPSVEPPAPQPPAVAVERPPVQTGTEAPAPAAVPGGAANEMLAALGKDGSALEPSPFGPARNVPPETEPALAAVPPPSAARPPTDAREKLLEKAERRERAERGIAAVAPVAPVVPEPAPLDIAPDAAAEPEPEASPENLVDTGRSPPGAPKVALSFLQWSADPAKRFAFVSIDGQPSQRIREGESAAGMTVAAITPTGVQFKREGTTFVIRPRH